MRDAALKLKGLRAHVIGDTIVDSYTYCSMIGGMTKTPTMSVRYERKVDFSGGAAVVAKQPCLARAGVPFFTLLGADPLKTFLLDDIEAPGGGGLPIIPTAR